MSDASTTRPGRVRRVLAGLIAALVLLAGGWQLSDMPSPFGGHQARPADCVIRDSSPLTPYCP